MKSSIQFKITLRVGEDRNLQTTRFQVGPENIPPENLLDWLKDNLRGPAVQAVLDFFNTSPEGEVWKTVDRDADTFGTKIREQLGIPYKLPDLGGAIHIIKVGEGPNAFAVHGRVSFTVETDEEE